MRAKPTRRDLASSAADLRGYAVLFRKMVTEADETERCFTDAAVLERAADFFDDVVDELLALIEDDQVSLPPNE